jgi:SAM-dependent methyltransferase
MEIPPDDAAARRRALERWLVEQRRASQGEVRNPSRVRLALRRAQWQLAHKYERLADRAFDRGLDTSAVAVGSEHKHPDRVPYVPSPWHVLPRALHCLGVSAADTFVDFGCGKGRVVHQAAKRPFHRVIGVEISPDLAETARRNLAARRHQHRCRNVEIVVADAAEFRVPDDLTIAYLFHPFVDDSFTALLGGIVDSIDRRPRRMRLIYVHPSHGSEVLATGRFRFLKEQRSRVLDTPLSRAAIFESL